MSGFLYLASQYTAPTKRKMHENFLDALHAKAWLLQQRHWVYSPIVHCHETARLHELPTNFEFWIDYNNAMIEASKGIIVLMTDGWKQSKGVKAEMIFAENLKLPRLWIAPSIKSAAYGEPYLVGEFGYPVAEQYADNAEV